jgi:hypothetical protein
VPAEGRPEGGRQPAVARLRHIERAGKGFKIAFGNTQKDANILVAGYRRSASSNLARRRLRSLLDLEGNAVIYWQTEPTAPEADAVRGCLS